MFLKKETWMIFAIGLCFSMTIVYLYCAVQRLSLKKSSAKRTTPFCGQTILSIADTILITTKKYWLGLKKCCSTRQIGSKDPLLQKEFWYVLTFINCPYISSSVKTALENIVRPMATAAETNLANKIKKIIAEFLLQNKSNLFFCWGYYHFNTSKQLTFRTYQRTLFKQYKNKRSIELYGSLDT